MHDFVYFSNWCNGSIPKSRITFRKENKLMTPSYDVLAGQEPCEAPAVTDCCPLQLSVTWESSCSTRDLISMFMCEHSRSHDVCNRARNEDCVVCVTKQKHGFGVCTPQGCSRCLSSIKVSNHSVPTFLQSGVWPMYLSGISHRVLACCCKHLAQLHTHSPSHTATRQRHLTQDSEIALYRGFFFHSTSCKPHLAGCKH